MAAKKQRAQTLEMQSFFIAPFFTLRSLREIILLLRHPLFYSKNIFVYQNITPTGKTVGLNFIKKNRPKEYGTVYIFHNGVSLKTGDHLSAQ